MLHSQSLTFIAKRMGAFLALAMLITFTYSCETDDGGDASSGAQYLINNETSEFLTVSGEDNGIPVELLVDQILPNSRMHFYTAIQGSGGHLLPSNYFDVFTISVGPTTVYEGVSDGDWEETTGANGERALELTIQ